MYHSSNVCGITVTNQNLIHEEIKRRQNSGNACYSSVQNLLSSCLLGKNVKVRIYKTIILPVVLYMCGTWSLTLREELKLSVFENRVLRSLFCPKKDEVMGGWRKLHNEELHDLYSSPSIIRIIKLRKIRWTGHMVQMREKRNMYRFLVANPLGKRPGRSRRRWVDNIKMDHVEVGWCGGDWIGVAQEQMESSCEYANESSIFIKCWETILWLDNRWALKYCLAQ
jgi:hypothetical protein